MIKRFTNKEKVDGGNRVSKDGIAGVAEAVLISVFDPTKMFVMGIFFNEVGESYDLIYVELETSKNRVDEGEFFPSKDLIEIDLQGMTASYVLKSPWYDYFIIN